MRLARFGVVVGALGALAMLGAAAAPVASAAPLDQHHHNRGHGAAFQNGFRNGFRAQQPIVVPVPVPAPVAPVAPVQALPVPVPVPVPVQAALPALNQVFPQAGFLQNPPQFIPLQNNMYAVSSPVLFCGPDQAGTCQLMAQQLAQITPGWGTTVMNGPQGYGEYLTFQNG